MDDYSDGVLSLKYQFYKHMANFTIKNFETGSVNCKYGFPWPIMESNCILEHIEQSTSAQKELKKHYLAYFDVLRNELTDIAKAYKTDGNQQKPEYGFERLLAQLSRKLNSKIYLEEYHLILRSSIKRSTVFLKRNCRELMLNPYNKFIICRHRANMDIQFVTDPYGAAAYVSAYMLKANAKMSVTLKRAQKEINAGNLGIRKRLLALANVFQNSSEIGAQECVYSLLSMSVAK